MLSGSGVIPVRYSVRSFRDTARIGVSLLGTVTAVPEHGSYPGLVTRSGMVGRIIGITGGITIDDISAVRIWVTIAIAIIVIRDIMDGASV